jgi:hypothetical protein
MQPWLQRSHRRAAPATVRALPGVERLLAGEATVSSFGAYLAYLAYLA